MTKSSPKLKNIQFMPAMETACPQLGPLAPPPPQRLPGRLRNQATEPNGNALREPMEAGRACSLDELLGYCSTAMCCSGGLVRS